MDLVRDPRFPGKVIGIKIRFFYLLVLAGCAVGCQSGAPTVSNRILLSHLPGINFTGLKPMEEVEDVAVSCSLPDHWIPLRLQTAPLYTHQQFKSPSGHTGLGIIYVRLPMSLNANTLLWFAKLEYSKKGNDGNALGEWTDSLGRPWFEAENDKYHVRGYAVVNGLNAWIVYSGYKLKYPPDPSDLSIAERSIKTVIPEVGAKDNGSSSVAGGEKNASEDKGNHNEG